MNKTSSAELLPLTERLRVIRLLRFVAAGVVLLASATIPDTRGAPLRLVAIVTVGYLATMLVIDAGWHLARRRALPVFGLMLMADALYLAWVSVGTAGLHTPLRNLVLLQLIVVSLIASLRTGMKLALWNSMLLVGAYHLEELGVLSALGNPHVNFGAHGYSQILVDVTILWLVAMTTASFAAVNERELRRRRYDLEALARLSLRLESASDASAVAELLTDAITDTFGYERVLVLGAGDRELHTLAGRGVVTTATVPLDSPLLREALAAPGPLLRTGAGDPVTDALLPGARNLALLALRAEGRSIGLVIVEHGLRRGSRIEARVVSMLERFASHAALALANVALLAEVRRSATIDGLTGLANRHELDLTLERECAATARTGDPLAVLMIDLDHFKALNDTHGHQAGDRALRLAAMAIAASTRSMDLAARYGGEEFCVVMPGVDAAAARTVADRIRRSIAEVSPDVPMTTSVGVASAPEHATTASALTAAADAALYQAKRDGRNRVAVSPRPTEMAA